MRLVDLGDSLLESEGGGDGKERKEERRGMMGLGRSRAKDEWIIRQHVYAFMYLCIYFGLVLVMIHTPSTSTCPTPKRNWYTTHTCTGATLTNQSTLRTSVTTLETQTAQLEAQISDTKAKLQFVYFHPILYLSNQQTRPNHYRPAPYSASS